MQQRETTESIRLVVSSGNLVLRTVALVKERITIGRRPFNDIALDHMTVSGEHAAIFRVGERRMIRDLHSRNGTIVNRQLVTEQLLNDGDLIEVGMYQLKFVVDAVIAAAPVNKRSAQAGARAFVEYLNGARPGLELSLERTVTSLGNHGAQVATIARRSNGYYLTHIEGPALPLVNGEAIGLQAHPLSHDDLIELSGTIMRFRFAA